MIDKPIVWIGSSRRDLRDFSDEARRKVGFELRAVQQGDVPSDFKPMPTIGPGVYEIRIQTGDAFRVFYLSKFEEGVYVLHAFQKKTQKTSKQDITIGRQRFKTAQEVHQQARK
jgi:phage-related protein